MGMNLVIVESAAKAKTIEKYLNNIPELKHHGDFRVMACFGHVRDLPSKSMGVKTDTWEVDYEAISKKKNVISKLRAAAKDACKVYLAADPDREGAAIAFHLRELLGLKRKQYERVVFHEITKKGIRDAFLHPKDIDMNEVDSQEARRVLDRVVGYELSPMLWRRFATSSLSAGRVQSAALKLLVDRAHEIEQHESEHVWTCEASFLTDDGVPLKAKAFFQGKQASYDDIRLVRDVVTQFASVRTWHAEFAQKQMNKNPPAPFTTSSLQQEAYARYGIPAKRTMQLAQGLYEAGHITYMRTDSTVMSEDAQAGIAGWIETTYGSSMVTPRQYATKNAHAQEAHECIRPTSPSLRGDTIPGEDFTANHKKLYDLIWKRSVASQMNPAEYALVTFDIADPGWDKKRDTIFHGFSKVLVSPGFLKLYNPITDESDHGDDGTIDDGTLSKWARYLEARNGTPVAIQEMQGRGDVTRPPSMFYEPSLVKSLEKEGIGRPSTYATIIDKLQEKAYVVKGCLPQKSIEVTHLIWHPIHGVQEQKDNVVIGGKNNDLLVPTSLGQRVVQYLQSIVPFLLDMSFTAEMESDLDNIHNNTKRKNEVLSAFYARFHSALETAQSECSAKRVEKGELQPKTILKELSAADIVQTRYGPAVFVRGEKRFVSLSPFLEWKSKVVCDVTDKDVKFLLSLPMKIDGTDRSVCFGPYGLYVKDENGTNIPMIDKALWDAAYDGTIRAMDIDGLVKKDYSKYRKGDKAQETKKKVKFIKKKTTI